MLSHAHRYTTSRDRLIEQIENRSCLKFIREVINNHRLRTLAFESQINLPSHVYMYACVYPDDLAPDKSTIDIPKDKMTFLFFSLDFQLRARTGKAAIYVLYTAIKSFFASLHLRSFLPASAATSFGRRRYISIYVNGLPHCFFFPSISFCQYCIWATRYVVGIYSAQSVSRVEKKTVLTRLMEIARARCIYDSTRD